VKKFSIAGVVLGGTVDVVVTELLAIVIVVVAILHGGIGRAAGSPAAITALMSSAPIFATLMVVGLACSVLGGYVAAWIAKNDELLNGACSAWLCMGIGVASLAFAAGNQPLWQRVPSEVISPVAGLAGGYLRALQKRRPLGP
jgi:hypothetical protein